MEKVWPVRTSVILILNQSGVLAFVATMLVARGVDCASGIVILQADRINKLG